MAYVEFREVKKQYRMGEVTIDALRDITFEIEKGRLSFRLTAPYSEERKQAASTLAKENSFFLRK